MHFFRQTLSLTNWKALLTLLQKEIPQPNKDNTQLLLMEATNKLEQDENLTIPVLYTEHILKAVFKSGYNHYTHWQIPDESHSPFTQDGSQDCVPPANTTTG